MEWRPSKSILFFLLLVLNGFSLFAEGYEEEPIEIRSFDREEWHREKSELNYEEDPEEKTLTRKEREEEEITEKEKRDWGFLEFMNWSFLRFVLIGLVILILVLIIYKLFQDHFQLGNKRVEYDTLYLMENLEEHIHESDLERLLRLALEDKNYRAAIRIYYLIIIKSLSEQMIIRWKKDKTNYEYLLEMRKSNHYNQFKEATYAFELVWYGDLGIDQESYEKLKPTFVTLMKNLITVE